MKEGKPSQTASLVALLRALADLGLTHVKGFRDPTARPLLTPSWARPFKAIEKRVARGERDTLLAAMRSGVDMMALRTRTIDVALEDALRAGATQVVILGAGLDGRPYRLDALKALRVFEIDHPATQAYKRTKVAELWPDARHVTFVPVNFERDSLDARLAAEGHRPDAPTAWIWEGVVMYLTEEALRGSLRTISARSAPGSTLIVNYHLERRRRLFSLLLRFWSEPQIGNRSREAMAAEVSAVGLTPVEDTGTTDWATRYGTPPPKFDTARSARILVARR